MKNFRLYYLIAFIEGASVMSIELAGAKMIAPFYGTSLYVWSSVLAVTLGGLTLGYFIGGRATYKYPGTKLLFLVLLVGAILIALMPLFALRVMPAMMDLGLRMASLISATCFMLLPLVCMGMVSPILIQLSNDELKGTGKTAGNIYAISTVGGIIMTLLMGFYLLPEWGIRKSIFLTASLLISMPVLLFFSNRKFKGWLISGLLVLSFVVLGSFKPFKDPQLYFHFLYQSEGILGQVSVLENPLPQSNRVFRLLFLNNIAQTKCNVDFIPASGWSYPHRLATLASVKPKGSRALLIGMGGGSVAMELKKMGFVVDVVEIDKRMPEIAETYFGFKPDNMTVNIDDGRHYIKSTNHKYDLVITDVLNGETQPSHLFTVEAFKDLKNILANDALVLINFQGYLKGKHGLAARSIYKTLIESGFNTKYFHQGTETEDGDIHFIATLGNLNFNSINANRLNDCCKVMEFNHADIITETALSVTDGLVLHDDQPKLEVIGNYWNEEYRKSSLNLFLKPYAENEIPFFQ